MRNDSGGRKRDEKEERASSVRALETMITTYVPDFFHQ